MLIVEEENEEGNRNRSGPYLIFVTDTRTVSVEKKSVMWRNAKFLYMTDEEKSKVSPHVN